MRCESEVSNFQVKLIVKYNIIKLQVSVSDSLTMQILQSIKQLSEIVPGYPLTECSSLIKVSKEFASPSNFEGKEPHCLEGLIIEQYGLHSVIDKLNHIFVVEFSLKVHLCF